MTLLTFRDFTIDPTRRRLLRVDTPIPLPAKAFDLLLYMASNPGRPLLKEELLSAVWPDAIVEESNLTHNIYQLRKALAASGFNTPGSEASDPILTLPGRGYQFTAPVATIEPSLSEPPSPTLSLPEPPPQPAPDSHKLTWLIPTLALALAALAFLLLRSQPTLRIASTVQLTDDGISKHLFVSPSGLFADDSHLRFIEQRNNRSFLADVPLAGGEVHSVPMPAPGAALVGFSNLNHTLLFGSDWHADDSRPILAQPLGSAAAQLGELTGHDASWSPDAHSVAIAKDRFLYLSNADGSNLHRIASADGIVYMPRWSPDGAVLRFSVNGSGLQDTLWEVNPDGVNLHQLFASEPFAYQVCCGAWSADGANFFFIVQSTVANNIWVLPRKSKLNPFSNPRPTPLTVSQNDIWQPPLPAPDGHALWSIGSRPRAELITVNPSTHQFESFLGGISAEGVSYSPDHQWIAYTAYPEGSLWVSHIDGSAKRQLTQPPIIARFPQWSPDGRTLAFISNKPGTNWQIYLVPASGGTPSLLLHEAASEGVPNWSPDGKQISFGRVLDYGIERNPDLTIEIYDLNAHTHTTLHDSEGLWTPRWSPDGRFLTALTQDNNTLLLYDFHTRQWSDLCHLAINDAIWSRDSRFLYFDTNLGSDAALYRIPFDPAHPADHQPERYADMRGLHRGGFFGPWIGITPDGAPLLLKDISIEEVYRLNLETSR